MKKIFLSGPYGNLSSLYTGIFASHPEVVGLDHGRHEVPANCEFYKPGDDMSGKLSLFVEHVCQNSQSWNNHARENGSLKDLGKIGSFQTESPTVVFWKESGYFTGWLRSCGLADKLLSLDKNVCLIRPIRDPVRCVITNSQNRHYLLYDDPIRGGNITETWELYLPWSDGAEITTKHLESGAARFLAEWWVSDLMWHVKLAEKYPNQVFMHFECDPFSTLAEKIDLPSTPEWLEAADKAAQSIIRKDINPLAHSLIAREMKKCLMWVRDPVADRVSLEFLSEHT